MKELLQDIPIIGWVMIALITVLKIYLIAQIFKDQRVINLIDDMRLELFKRLMKE